MEVDGARNINGVTSKPNVFETLNVDGIRGGNARVEEATYRKKRTRCIIILLTTIIVVVASIAVAVGVGLGVVLGRKTKDTDECLSSPCHNGATCIDNVDGYTCTCANGWMGIYCEKDIDECQSHPCQNRATCNDLINGFACTCANGWTGTHCEEAVYYGNSFITEFMKDNTDNSGIPSLLIICPEREANITVSIPALSIVNEHHEIIDGALKLTYSNASASYISGVISKKGVHITSDRQVVVFAGSLIDGSADGSLVPPEFSLGTNYIISGYPNYMYSSSDEFLIVCTVDKTKITVTVKSVTETITLNRMETYFFTQRNLSGSTISSTNPVYVVSGHSCANIPNDDVNYCDYIDEVMPPISSLGKLHVVTYMSPRPDFTISVVSPYSNTTVKIYSAAGVVKETITSMKRADAIFRTYTGSQSLLIVATQPVLVTQYGHGANGTGVGDPSMMTIPDVNHFGHRYDFVALNKFYSTITLVINSSYSMNGLLLDDVAFTPTETITASISGYGDFDIVYANVAPGYHRLAHTAGTNVSFGAWLYGRQRDAEYAWSLGHTY